MPQAPDPLSISKLRVLGGPWVIIFRVQDCSCWSQLEPNQGILGAYHRVICRAMSRF